MYVRKGRTLVFAFFFNLLPLSGLYSQITAGDNHFIDSLLTSRYPSSLPGASVIVAKDGKILFEKAYGLSDAKLKTADSTGTLFPICSMSKQFTAVCILQLAQQGKLSLTDDINTYLPFYNSHHHKITIENLLTHTSGIPEFTENPDYTEDHPYSKDELVKLIMKDSLLFEPGSNFSYSNSGYTLLAFIVEHVSGMPFKTYLEKNIFQKAGLTRTYEVENDTAVPPIPRGYYCENKNVTDGEKFTWLNNIGCGGIVSCTEDLLKWDEALYNGSIVGKEWLDKAFTPFYIKNHVSANYGYGWGMGEYEGIKFIEHLGDGDGYKSVGLRIPSRHMCVYILTNNGSVSAAYSANLIAMHLLKLPIPSPGKYKPPHNDLNQYVGTYTYDRYAVYMSDSHCYVTLIGDTLSMQEPVNTKMLLYPVSKDVFTPNRSGIQYYHFISNAKGEVVSLSVYNIPLNWGVTSSRKKLSDTTLDDARFISLSSEQTKRVCGKYYFGKEIDTCGIISSGNKLYFQFHGQPANEIFAKTPLYFIEKDNAVEYEFIPDNKGAIAALKIHAIIDLNGIKVHD